MTREFARRAAVEELKRLHIPGAAGLVNAAVPRESRKDQGASRQGTAISFQPVDPWPEEVSGPALISDLVALFLRYLAIPEEVAHAAALWVLFSHAHDAFEISPILAVTSPEKRCGKSTLLALLGALVPRPLSASNITAAAVFRSIEELSPTLLIDEADTFLRHHDDLRGVLNSGHQRGTAFVVRLVLSGDDYVARQFGTWCPKAIACIGDLPDTLEDRAIVLRMQRRRREERVEKLRLDRLSEHKAIQRRAVRWVADNLDAIRVADPQLPDGLHDRAEDNWRPLISIADAAGGSWPDHARKAAALLCGQISADQAPAEQLLADLSLLFAQTGQGRLPTEEIIPYLTKMEDRPWPEWKDGRPLTVIQLAKLLLRFGIRPKTTRFGERTLRGYESSDFADAFARYIPADPKQAQQPGPSASSSLSAAATTRDHVSDRTSQEKACRALFVSDVADQTLAIGHDPVGDVERAIERDGIASEAAL